MLVCGVGPFANGAGKDIRRRVILPRAPLAALVVALVGLGFCVAALAETAALTIDSRSPALAERDGGGWTTSLGFTNVTDRAIALTAQPKRDRGRWLHPGARQE